MRLVKVQLNSDKKIVDAIKSNSEYYFSTDLGLEKKYGEDGKPTEFGTIEPDRFDGMYAEYIQNGRFLTNEDGSYKGGWKEDEVKYFMSARSAGTQQLQQVQFNAQQLSSNFANFLRFLRQLKIIK